jgi:hypothetical protein
MPRDPYRVLGGSVAPSWGIGPGSAALLAKSGARQDRAAIRTPLVLATIAAKEETGQNVYVKQRETAGTRMSAQERWHAKVLKQVSVTSSLRRVFRLS